MDNLTDFTNTEDVSDAAIEWVLRETGSDESVRTVRYWARQPEAYASRPRILAARLIQRHHPELLVDPVDAIVREELAKAYESVGFTQSVERYRNGVYDNCAGFQAAKRLYLLGIEKGKQS